VGYKKEVLSCSRGSSGERTIQEQLITITTDIAQVLPDGRFLMIDSDDLKKAEEGKRIFAIIRDLVTGNQTSNKYYKFGEHILPSMWGEYEYRYQYETEKDYG
jgi:hypothetical protein